MLQKLLFGQKKQHKTMRQSIQHSVIKTLYKEHQPKTRLRVFAPIFYPNKSFTLFEIHDTSLVVCRNRSMTFLHARHHLSLYYDLVSVFSSTRAVFSLFIFPFFLFPVKLGCRSKHLSSCHLLIFPSPPRHSICHDDL